MPTYGLEEEVFVTEPERPSPQSLYYLAKLLWRRPDFYYTHSASNFARGEDIKQGVMAGVEIGTDKHTSVNSLLDDFVQRRKDLMGVVEGLIIPLGHLIDVEAPTCTCAFQIHIGQLSCKEVAYENLAYFLPVLMLLTANSPLVKGQYFGKSYRIARGYAIGSLREDSTYRFQDLIVSKRLKTIEVRVPDPTWDLERIKVFLGAVEAIVNLPRPIGSDRLWYNSIRDRVARVGFVEEVEEVYRRLANLCEIPRHFVEQSPSDEVVALFEREGLLKTYSALDNAYRTGRLEPREILPVNKSYLKMCAGFTGYYVPRLPYMAWKYWRE